MCVCGEKLIEHEIVAVCVTIASRSWAATVEKMKRYHACGNIYNNSSRFLIMEVKQRFSSIENGKESEGLIKKIKTKRRAKAWTESSNNFLTMNFRVRQTLVLIQLMSERKR